MQVGIKLELGFATSDDYRRLFGRHEVLDFVRSLGVEAAETPIGPATKDEALIEHAERCADAGLRLSLHPYTERTPHNPAFFSPEEGKQSPRKTCQAPFAGNRPSGCFAQMVPDTLSSSDPTLCRRAHERFFALAERAAQRQGAETIVNVHAAAAVEHPRERLLARSIEFFAWARRWCELRGAGVRVVAELQIVPMPHEGIRRIGDSYAELLAVLRGSGAGACWDFGHAVMNHRRFGQPLEPPEELLGRVVHVHCHDVGEGDHQPLVFGNVPWERFLGSLADRGFDGTVILEVPAAHFAAAGGLDALQRSVAALKRVIDKPAPAPS